MKIEHVAIWVDNLEKMKQFYQQYFGAASSEKYTNAVKQFESYFLSFDSGCRIELMRRPGIGQRTMAYDKQQYGLVHLAFACHTKAAIDGLTERLRQDGYTIAGEPRTTGDGYYESMVLDPENNIIEITEAP